MELASHRCVATEWFGGLLPTWRGEPGKQLRHQQHQLFLRGAIPVGGKPGRQAVPQLTLV